MPVLSFKQLRKRGRPEYALTLSSAWSLILSLPPLSLRAYRRSIPSLRNLARTLPSGKERDFLFRTTGSVSGFSNVVFLARRKPAVRASWDGMFYVAQNPNRSAASERDLP